jgi:arsenate reductase (glutaredoxin)
MSLQILHNPKCSKSRETLGLISENGQEPEIVEYLKDFPSKENLRSVVQKLGMPITSIIRFKETIAKELGLTAKDERSQDEWLELLCENPKLLERPIVIKGDQAIMGRPPENVLQLL